MDKITFLNKARSSGLARVAEMIASSTKDCIHLSSLPANDDRLPVGVSKLGGDPDVPGNFAWPAWKDVKLAFMIQINLSDISKFGQVELLPSSGLLSFFYHPDQKIWGFDPKDRGSWQIFYFPDISDLKRTATPELNSEFNLKKYPSCQVNFTPEISYPDLFSELIQKMGLSNDEMKAYGDIHEQTKPQAPLHQLLGHPYPIQNSMEIECELVSNGIYTGDIKWTQHPQLEDYRRTAKDWQLLLQLDSDDNAEMMWGDVGMVYYWIKVGDLQARMFSNSWFILQCT